MHYPGSGPVYPPADRYVEAFGEAQLRHWLARRNIGGATLPLSAGAQYTPAPPSISGTPARHSAVSEKHLAAEIRLVGESLLDQDRPLFDRALAGSGEGAWPSDVIGLGPGAFGRVGPACYQNYARPEQYCAALEAGRLPVWRGLELTADDLARRAIIESLHRHGRVSMEAIEIAHVLDFPSYFAPELADLKRLEQDGLVELRPGWIEVTAHGRPGTVAISAVFDGYARERRRRESVGRIV
jgi:hypothetical protein